MPITIYVSPSGNDANPGTQAQPVATPGAAQTLVQAILPTQSDNIVVRILTGVYSMPSTLALTSTDSGNNGFTVTWQGDGLSNTILSGADQLTGWTQTDATKNIWQTAWTRSGSPRAMFAGGNRVYRVIGVLAAGTVSTGGYTSTGGALFGTRNPTNIEFCYSADFSCQFNKVASVAATTITMLAPAHGYITVTPNITGTTFPLFTTNVYEDFTAQAQRNSFYCDNVNSIIYWIPAYGQTPNTTVVYAPNGLTQSLVTMTGCNNVYWNGVGFHHAHWGMSTGFAEDAQAFYRSTATPSPSDTPFNSLSPVEALYISGCTNGGVTACGFKHLTGSGLAVRDQSQYYSITGNYFTDISFVGLSISDISEASLSTCTDSVVCSNNYFAYMGREGWGSPAIRAPYVSNTTIAQNYILDCGYVGIGYGYSLAAHTSTRAKCLNNAITNNRLIACMTRLQDGASLYCQAPNGSGTTTELIVSGNWVSSVWTLVGNAYAYYFDEGSSNISFLNNLCDNLQSWINTHSLIGTNVIYGTNYSTTTTHGVDATLPPYVDPTVSASPSTSVGGAPIAAACGLQSPYNSYIPAAPSWGAFIASLSPTAWYKQAEPSGTTATDSSGNGYNGTYSNVTLAQTPLIPSLPSQTSASYNGTSSTMNSGKSTQFNYVSAAGTPSDFTVISIRQPNSARSGFTAEAVISKLDPGGVNAGWEYGDLYTATTVGPNNRNVQSISIANNFSSSRASMIGAMDLANGNAICTITVFRGGFSSFNILQYVNGTSDGYALGNIANTLSGSPASTANLYLGSRGGSGSNWVGLEADQIIVPYALTDAQVYQAGQAASVYRKFYSNGPILPIPVRESIKF